MLSPSLKAFTNHADILSEFLELLRLPSANFKPNLHHDVAHAIITTGLPTTSRPRRLPPDRLKATRLEFEFMLQQGLCRPSKSPWASPLHLVQKKNGDWRSCGDYRRLNAITVPSSYPIPYLHDCVQLLHGTSIYSILDLIRVYQRIPVREEDIPKTAIITPFGLFEFPYMSFGLRNAAQTFQCFINEVIRGLDFCVAYLNDILVASSDPEQHKEHLRLLCQRLKYYGISINASKCVFGAQEVNFLGHKISADGVMPLPEKVQAIKDVSEPNDIKSFKRFLGMINFYHRFLPKIALLQIPLQKVLRGHKKGSRIKLVWTEEMCSSFNRLKTELANATLLSFPDSEAELSLQTDASDTAIGAVIQQKVHNIWKPLSFFSRKLTPTQAKYSTYDRELLAIHAAIKHFHHWLDGRIFHVLTDHLPLTSAFKNKTDKVSPRQSRQLSDISEFTTDIRYVAGPDNVVADVLYQELMSYYKIIINNMFIHLLKLIHW